MRVYQQGQRSASDDSAVCPYGVGDWRAVTWTKGRQAGQNYWREFEDRIAEQKEQAEPVVERDLLSETQAALRDSWAIIMKLKAVQDAARALVESDPDSAADTEGEAFTAWCVLVAAIDDADTLLCNFGESNAAM
jgi:hypothetical protein